MWRSEISIGGSLWLAPKGAEHPAFDEDECTLPTDLAFTADYKIQPHNWNFPDGCARNGLLTAGKTYLVIVGESSGWNGWGNGRVPTIRGYAPFVVTGWRFGPKQRVEYSGWSHVVVVHERQGLPWDPGLLHRRCC